MNAVVSPRMFAPPSKPEARSRRLSDAEFRKELVKAIPRLRRFAASYCGTTADADDAVQITCERALVRWQQWTGRGRLEHWLISILLNARRDEERARAGKRLCPLEAIPEPRAGPKMDEEVYLEQVELEMLRLPGHLHDTLRLVACEGLSYREAALALRIRVGTVMSRLSRARHVLKVRLAHPTSQDPLLRSSQALPGRDRTSARDTAASPAWLPAPAPRP